MNTKVTWNIIFNEFKSRHPSLARQVMDYRPKGQMEIMVWLHDGRELIYNYLSKKARFAYIPEEQKTYRVERSYINFSEEEWRNEFSIRLKALLQAKKITQKELSNITNISERMITKYANAISTPSYYNILKLARALDCSTSDLTDF